MKTRSKEENDLEPYFKRSDSYYRAVMHTDAVRIYSYLYRTTDPDHSVFKHYNDILV
jgi:hypothetical protein